MANADYDSSRPDIADEAKAYLTNPLEVSNFHVMFRDSNGHSISDPHWTLDELEPFLQTEVDSAEFGNRFDYLPDLLSSALYGTPDLWPLLMRLNGAGTRSEFKGPRFRYIKKDSFGTLLQTLRLARDRQLSTKTGVQYGDLTVREVPVR